MYKRRHVIENFLCKLEEPKPIAMRGCKTDQGFQVIIYLSATAINARSITTVLRPSAPGYALLDAAVLFLFVQQPGLGAFVGLGLDMAGLTLRGLGELLARILAVDVLRAEFLCGDEEAAYAIPPASAGDENSRARGRGDRCQRAAVPQSQV
ncbi:MAG TPA: hypothetical protein VF463_02200 [Sphingobium sp.]